jgi:hypothetical protein
MNQATLSETVINKNAKRRFLPSLTKVVSLAVFDIDACN